MSDENDLAGRLRKAELTIHNLRQQMERNRNELRDHYAGLVMQADLQQAGPERTMWGVAKYAFDMADAMMRERELWQESGVGNPND